MIFGLLDYLVNFFLSTASASCFITLLHFLCMWRKRDKSGDGAECGGSAEDGKKHSWDNYVLIGK